MLSILCDRKANDSYQGLLQPQATFQTEVGHHSPHYGIALERQYSTHSRQRHSDICDRRQREKAETESELMA